MFLLNSVCDPERFWRHRWGGRATWPDQSGVWTSSRGQFGPISTMMKWRMTKSCRPLRGL